MKNKKIYFFSILILAGLLLFNPAGANGLPDFDKDGIPNKDEKNIYYTDVDNPDTDGDGYSDREELLNGYSPHNPEPVKLKDNDADGDGLSDKDELRFGTNLLKTDTDGDGWSDKEEIDFGYDPLNPEPIKLEKRIEINTGEQTLSYFLDGVKRDTFLISSGRASMPTSKGHFLIINKAPRAWSPYGLWMPYWLGLGTGSFGIHQLPVWPNGYREGEDHLGTPVSHGCIRLGIEPAEFLYDWAEVGTPVFIY